MAGEIKQMYAGSPFPLTVVSVATNIASNYVAGNYVAGNLVVVDNSILQCMQAVAVLRCNGFVSSPTANSYISLWAVPREIDGVSVHSTPGSTVDATPAAESGVKSTAGAWYLGSFSLPNANIAQNIAIPISLIGLSKFSTFIKNESGQTVVAGVGTECIVKLHLFTFGTA